VIAKSATGLTVRVAATAEAFGPTDVVSEPAGIPFTSCGEETEVTTTDTEQLAPGGITVFWGTNKLATEAVARGTELIQVVARPGEAELTKPAGYASMKLELNVAEVSRWLFVNVITNSDVLPA
jgi:hypothetical protein